jgi:hypothetical protein
MADAGSDVHQGLQTFISYGVVKEELPWRTLGGKATAKATANHWATHCFGCVLSTAIPTGLIVIRG